MIRNVTMNLEKMPIIKNTISLKGCSTGTYEVSSDERLFGFVGSVLQFFAENTVIDVGDFGDFLINTASVPIARGLTIVAALHVARKRGLFLSFCGNDKDDKKNEKKDGPKIETGFGEAIDVNTKKPSMRKFDKYSHRPFKGPKIPPSSVSSDIRVGDKWK